MPSFGSWSGLKRSTVFTFGLISRGGSGSRTSGGGWGVAVCGEQWKIKHEMQRVTLACLKPTFFSRSCIPSSHLQTVSLCERWPPPCSAPAPPGSLPPIPALFYTLASLLSSLCVGPVSSLSQVHVVLDVFFMSMYSTPRHPLEITEGGWEEKSK